jgi:hypothetical protein
VKTPWREEVWPRSPLRRPVAPWPAPVQVISRRESREPMGRASTTTVDSAVMKALPEMATRYPRWPSDTAVPSSVPVKVCPVTLSCTKESPGCMTPRAARVATFAVVPVPQGERSTMPGSMTTMIRASAPTDRAGLYSCTWVTPLMASFTG